MQGFNMGRYVPPDVEGVASGNKLHKKRPPGIRASGEQVVRFEMPFAVWCSHCPKPTLIPQGVRFNAVKEKVGNYYSTPIWAFRIKHAECGGTLVVKTDPQRTEYVVAEGGRRRDTGPEEEEGEGVYPGAKRPGLRDEGNREEARQSAFAKLEKTIEDREVLAASSERIDRLEEDRERGWADPYAANRALRRHFRVGRHAREQEARENGDLRERLGGIDEGLVILPENEEDRRRVALVEFGKGKNGGEEGVMERPLFELKGRQSKGLWTGAGTGDAAGPKMTKAEALAKKTREGLAARVASSVRKVKDPFLVRNSLDAAQKPPVLPALKRKRDDGINTTSASKERKMLPDDSLESVEQQNLPTTPLAKSKTGGLVAYDSDSE